MVRKETQSTDVEEAKCKVYLAAVDQGAWQRPPGCLSVCHLSFQWGICCHPCFCPTVYKMLFLPGHWCGLVSLPLLLLLHASLACLQVYFLFIFRITPTIILTKCSLYPSLFSSLRFRHILRYPNFVHSSVMLILVFILSPYVS